ncbi:MAG: NAD(P)H-binding protein, partial [Chitinophagaceae bacterium]
MKAVLTGATGLIGNELLKILLIKPWIESVTVLTRKALAFTHPKMIVRVIDFDNLQHIEQSFDSVDVIFSCVGTTQSQVKGDKSAYRKVDHDIPVNVAQAGLRKGARKFILVSSVGADKNSGNFYLKLKGEVEFKISSLGFDSVYLFRPSFLLGRKDNTRAAEAFVRPLMRLFSIAMLGGLEKYKSIEAEDVAQAMAEASRLEKTGIYI